MALISEMLASAEYKFGTYIAAEKELKERYGEEFVGYEIGNRINTGTATIYLHPADNDKLNFKAVYRFEDKKLTDEYLLRRAAYAVDGEIKAALAEVGLEAASFTTLWGADDEGLVKTDDIAGFIRDCGTSEFYTHIAMKADDMKTEGDLQKLIDVLLKLSGAYDGINIISALHLFPDEAFAKCTEALLTCAVVNDEWYRGFGESAKTVVNIKNGAAEKTAAEILSTI